jgi:hypothetical protein
VVNEKEKVVDATYGEKIGSNHVHIESLGVLSSRVPPYEKNGKNICPSGLVLFHS